MSFQAMLWGPEPSIPCTSVLSPCAARFFPGLPPEDGLSSVCKAVLGVWVGVEVRSGGGREQRG